MRVAVVPIDRFGVGSYRAVWPAEAARAAGVDVTIVDPDAEHVFDFDVVVIQVPVGAQHLAAMEQLQQRGIRVVVEVDDDYSRIPPKNRAWDRVQWANNPDRGHEYLAVACHRADWVTTTTDRLAQVYGSHGRVSVIPNTIPARYLDLPSQAPTDAVLVGWAGTVGNHPNDLQVVGDAVRRLPGDVVLAIIGPDDGASTILDEARPTVKSGWQPILEYSGWLAGLNVGMVPLARSLFNEAKSWLKGLEYAACGVPFVATPTASYRQLHRVVGGRLAATPDEWHRHLTELCASAELRADEAGRARLAAAAWTMEGNVHRWVEAWAAAIHQPRATPAVPSVLSGSAAHSR